MICMFWSKSKKPKLIPVVPKNYRKISLTAIELASDPHVLINKREIYDFSEQGPLTQEGIRGCLDFEIKDGKKRIIGFHDDPSEMWVTHEYESFAHQCEMKGWLKIKGPAS